MASSLLYRRAIPADARISRWQAPGGWMLRTFEWPAGGEDAPRGSILFQTGRGDMFEKYLELFSHWHAKGWAISAFDWRGQGGSGRLADDPHCGHIDDFATYISDLKAFYRDWRERAVGPRIVMGHSMGGHLVLRALVEGAIRPDAAVLIAPMLGLKTPFGARLAEWLARLLGNVGNSARPAWKRNEKPNTTESRQALLTHDGDRYSDELFWQQAKPELLTGPPSWNWLIEAFRSCRELRANRALSRMDVPLLMLVARNDALVDPKAALAIAAKLPDSRTVRFGPEAAHEILREVDSVRNRAIGEIDLFLDARAGRR
ncbi:alpha/beta hydrolase [Stakelama sp. CBK3Z-3]|uniref:Alpha/beta hydrolase n=1 Tax=Stakelama flava TaxID=2860338 RepID=A0ABS6XMS0_9SPHN|nr:alpha/beta hydrolase [Stakelama flava]MBW4331494.1 alpha/beta hydrolase [Stakelama flava]